jgi:hypothetical protein
MPGPDKTQSGSAYEAFRHASAFPFAGEVIMSTVDVKVDVAYDATTDKMAVTISPWRAEVSKDDDAEWTVTGGTNADIAGKGPWPFDKVSGGNKPKVKPGKGAVAGQTYTYQIMMKCGLYDVVIDPEMIIKK